MPSISLSLSSFTKTNTDMPAGTTFTAAASGATVSGAYITSGTLYLSSIRTYTGVGYLDFSLGSGTGSTGTFSSNSSTHSETVTLTGYSNALLTAGSGTVSFTLRRTSGSGNILNLRSGITGTLTLNYAINPTACTAPSACSVGSTLSEGNVTLSWSGAAGGTNNTIASYEVQYSESSDNATWGAWTALTTVTTTATSGSVSVAPSSTRGNYRRFQVRTCGSAGASYYSGWKVSTNSVRRNTLPTAPTTVTATPAVYSTEAISLTWSGAAGGTSAIKGFTIASRTSTDNSTWSAWATLTTLTQTAGSGSYAPTVSRVIGTYTQFGVTTIDALDVSSSLCTSASILCSITPCNAKFNGEHKCATPHLTEDEIKAMFLKAYNQLMGNRERVITDCRFMLDMLCDHSKLDAQIAKANDEIALVSGLVSACVHENAEKAQSQDAYSSIYNGLVDRHQKAIERLEKLKAAFADKVSRERELRSFIDTLATSPLVLDTWDEQLWRLLVVKGVVGRGGSIDFDFLRDNPSSI